MAGPGLIGSKAGNYIIKERIGRSELALVFRAEHPRLGRQVAVKVLAPHLAVREKMIQRFEWEARACASLEHPNIVEIFDFGSLQYDVPFYVMELLEGQHLGRALARQPLESPRQALPLVEQICSALQAAHDAGIVHRDLKPENVFLVEGEPVKVKLLDFGIAVLAEQDEHSGLTTTGLVLGTPTWAAPEQVSGWRDQISPRTDLYSLGVMIYWMLCGSPPFESKQAMALSIQHREAAPPPLGERCPELPEALVELVHSCLAKAPDQRPESASLVARRFAEALGGGPADDIAALDREVAALRDDSTPEYKKLGIDTEVARYIGLTTDQASERPKPKVKPAEPSLDLMETKPMGPRADKPARDTAPMAPPSMPIVQPELRYHPHLDPQQRVEGVELGPRADEPPVQEDAGPFGADDGHRDTAILPLLGDVSQPDRATQAPPEQQPETVLDEPTLESATTTFLDPSELAANQEEERKTDVLPMLGDQAAQTQGLDEDPTIEANPLIQGWVVDDETDPDGEV